jgi:hypothetical protein
MAHAVYIQTKRHDDALTRVGVPGALHTGIGQVAFPCSAYIAADVWQFRVEVVASGARAVLCTLRTCKTIVCVCVCMHVRAWKVYICVRVYVCVTSILPSGVCVVECAHV